MSWLDDLRLRLRLLNRQRLRRRHARRGPGYDEWVARYDTLGTAAIEALQARLAALADRPRFAVLMPVYNPPIEYLRQAIDSVRAQIYPEWELCIVDDASTDAAVAALLTEAAASDPRVRCLRRPANGHIVAASNDALAMARSPFVALLDHDDVLRPHALLLLAEALQRRPDAQVLYSDEDKLDIEGRRHDPYFKPDWNPELLLAQNYLAHLVSYRTERVREAGGFRAGFEGAQDHDLALRCTEGLQAGQIVHIPHVLYHWRQHGGSTASRNAVKPYAQAAGLRAVQEAVARRGLAAAVTADRHGWYAVRPQALQPSPSVTIIVPTRDGMDTLPRCVRSLLEKTDHANWRLTVVDNGSADPRFLDYLAALAADPRCRVVRDARPFNFAALNNDAVAGADTEFVALLNDDTEVLSPDWLTQMVGWAALPDVGAVGARLWYPDMSLQHGGVVLGIGGVAGHAHRHLGREAVGQRGRGVLLQSFSAVTAACLVVRRSHYLQVGGMDAEHLAVAFNDIDFCLRLRARGLRNLWAADVQLIHYESASRGSDRHARHRQRHAREAAVMQQRWGDLLRRDPAYNPNLSLEGENFELAFPPRGDHFEPDSATRRAP